LRRDLQTCFPKSFNYLFNLSHLFLFPMVVRNGPPSIGKTSVLSVKWSDLNFHT
jgi:hypothetical protein